jgi:hypothetical protein
MSLGSNAQPKVGRRRRWVSLSVLLFLLFVLTSIFLTATLDYCGVIDVYPKSEEGYICAVCGRGKRVMHQFGTTRLTHKDSLGTKYADRVVGAHQHIWVGDSSFVRTFAGGQVGDSFAFLEVPIVVHGVPRALGMLEGTEYLEPVVKALCDVDNYYAYLARDVLVWGSLDVFHGDRAPTPQQLDEWWKQKKQFFVIEHDPEGALPVLKAIEKGEEPYCLLQEAARQTLEYHDRYGVPTLGAVVSHALQQKDGD